MKLVLTGANGFVGSHAAHILSARGHAVHAVVRSTSDVSWLDGADITLHRTGLDDVDALVPLLDGADGVLHVAGTVQARDLEGYRRGNVGLTRNVLEAAVQSGGAPAVVCVSSIAASGPAPAGGIKTEGDARRPVSLYGRSKVEAEDLAAGFRDRLPVSILRPAIVYGERDTEFFAFIQAIDRGIFPRVGRSEKWVDVVYVGDLVRAMEQAVERRSSGTYFITSGEEHHWAHIARTTGDVLGSRYRTLTIPHGVLTAAGHLSGFVNRFKKRPSVFDADKAREGIQERWVHSIERARRELGYAPDVGLRDGLERSVAWYRANGWL